MKKRLLTLLICVCALLVTLMSAYGSYESQTVISKSYLEGRFQQELEAMTAGKIEATLGSLGDNALNRLSALARSYLNKLSAHTGDGDPNWVVSDSFQPLQRIKDDTLTLAPGAGLIWVSGSARFSGTLIDLTAGAEVTNGTLTAGHRYVAAEKTVLTVDSDTAAWAAEGKWQATDLYNSVASIAITQPPAKLTYYVGEELDTTGMVVTATYRNGTSEPVTGYTLSGYDPNTLGEQTVTVTCEGLTASFTVTVESFAVESIAVTQPPAKLTYYPGEALDGAGMVVTATYTDGTAEAVTDYTLTGYDNTLPGEQTVTVTYKGATATFTVTVVSTPMTSIAITQPPAKLTYFAGQELDAAGMVVTATYDDGATAVITGCTLSGYDPSTPGEQTITVTWGELTAAFTVTVEAVTAESMAITQPPAKLEYYAGEALDTAGMVVSVTYNNGDTAAITDYTLSGYDPSTLGEQTVTVTWGELTAAFPVTVIKSPLPDSITSDAFTVTGGMIRKIPLGTTVQALVEGIHEKDHIRVFKGDAEVTGDTPVGTGMTVKLMDGDSVITAVTAVVTGDINGDGRITITDMLSARSHLLKKTTLTDAPALAADANGDGKITITDFLQLTSHVLGKSSITSN